jgi:hypothetical protein
MQKRKHSLLESVTNTVTGLLVSFGIQLVIYPALDIPVKLSQNVNKLCIFIAWKR